jgi:cytochrome c oxidase subunit 3
MSDHTQNHPYHLVEPSPWPALGALAGFLLFGGIALYLHPGLLGTGLRGTVELFGPWVIAPGLLLALYTMLRWWMDVVREATVEGHHTPVVQIGLRYGMALFIASEVMFFAAFFWAFFNAALFPTLQIEFSWPPPGIEVFDPLDIPLLNTLILLTSGFTVTWAHHDIRSGQMGHAAKMLKVTVLLGLIFTALQASEYAEATFGFADGIYPTIFYMATGFHGFHVIVGTIFLAVCLIRTSKGHFTADHHFGFEAAAWYWHFVDVVWLFLYCFVYWWGG